MNSASSRCCWPCSKRCGQTKSARLKVPSGRAARAVASGAPFIERVDLLVKLISHQLGMPNAETRARASGADSASARSIQRAPGEFAMAKGQMRSNKEKKKPKADKNLKKGGAAPVNPFASGKTPAGQSPNSKKS
jgi:hypothetical protein